MQEIIGTFGRDRRIVVWDLYNEPGNSGMSQRSLPLVEAAFGWARETSPVQPLTVGVWTDFGGEMSQRLFALSDVVSFQKEHWLTAGVDGMNGALDDGGLPVTPDARLVHQGCGIGYHDWLAAQHRVAMAAARTLPL